MKTHRKTLVRITDFHFIRVLGDEKEKEKNYLQRRLYLALLFGYEVIENKAVVLPCSRMHLVPLFYISIKPRITLPPKKRGGEMNVY